MDKLPVFQDLHVRDPLGAGFRAEGFGFLTRVDDVNPAFTLRTLTMGSMVYYIPFLWVYNAGFVSSTVSYI